MVPPHMHWEDTCPSLHAARFVHTFDKLQARGEIQVVLAGFACAATQHIWELIPHGWHLLVELQKSGCEGEPLGHCAAPVPGQHGAFAVPHE